MPFIPVPDTALVELVFELFGQIVENTLYFKSDHAMTSGDLAQLLTDFHPWVYDGLMSWLSHDITLNRLQATALDSDMAPVATFVPSTSEFGSIAEDSAPGNVTVAMGFRTAGRGRSSRGRNYVPGIPVTQIEGNQIASTYAAHLLSAYEGIPINTWTDVSLQHVVVSRQHNNVVLSEGVTYPVTAYVLANRDLDSQRRRLTGRGM